MAMEINSNYKDYKKDYMEKVLAEQDKARELDKEQRVENESKGIPVPKDEYISGEKSDRRPTGLYCLGQDGSGNPKVLYEDPKKVTNGKEVQMKAETSQKAEDCTTNTDKVDREIEKLKEEKKKLEQQIKAAAGDEEKIKELKNKLNQLEGEISQKDNDTYRQQNAVIS